MNLLSLAPVLFAATSKSTTKSSSSATFLIFIVIVVAALYFLFLRPNQQRAKKARQDNSAIGVGDHVVSIGGIVGRIEEMQGDRVVLLTGDSGVDGDDAAPTRIVLLRTAIARKVDVASNSALPDLEDHEDADDDEHDAADHDHDHDHDHGAGDTGNAEGDAGA